MADVKTPRAVRARRTRARIVAVAADLFVTRGYAATTVERIAEEAGVAVQTVYYTFRTKGGLLREVVEVTAAGSDSPVPVTERAWWQRAMRMTSPSGVLSLAVQHGTAIYERVAPLWPAVDAACAADPEVAEYWQDVGAARRAGQRRLVEHLAEVGGLRQGLTVERATDLVVMYLGHEVYSSLVVHAGWTVAEYRDWLIDALSRECLGPVASE